MVPLWFTLSALCFVGAAVLLYVDIDRRRGLGRRRKSWAKSHGFDYEHESGDILKRWKRGVMSTVGDITAKNVVLGQIRGEALQLAIRLLQADTGFQSREDFRRPRRAAHQRDGTQRQPQCGSGHASHLG